MMDKGGVTSGTNFTLQPGKGYLLFSDSAGSAQPAMAGWLGHRRLVQRCEPAPPVVAAMPPSLAGA